MANARILRRDQTQPIFHWLVFWVSRLVKRNFYVSHRVKREKIASPNTRDTNMLVFFVLFTIYHAQRKVNIITEPCVYISCTIYITSAVWSRRLSYTCTSQLMAHSPRTVLVPLALSNSTCPVVGGWKGKPQTVF